MQKEKRPMTGKEERHDSQPSALVNKYCELQYQLNHALLHANKHS
jgi:hypothetical protein